ncbi:hypothetical protein [Paludisphaera sp.]|uniref:hypothetical protein n=1 Tax=Paludisphaera sp. TaxID=2017432 RepID=UPI00301CA856
MRNLEALSQFIVPLVFLAIWALTSILNQEGQSLPKRPGARPGPRPAPEPRPAGQVARAEAASRREDFAAHAEEVASRAASGREPDSSGPRRIGTARPPGRSTDADVYVIGDEMVFVDPATRRRIGSATVPGAGKPTGGTPRRKPSRARRAEQVDARPDRGDPDTRRALSEQVGQSMAHDRGPAMTALTPLSSGFTGLGAKSLRVSSTAAPMVAADAPPILSAADVRRKMLEPGRLLEMIVLTEILQPPVSRRGRRM